MIAPGQTVRTEWIAAALAVVCYVNVVANDFCNDGKPIVASSAKVNAPGQWLAIWTTDYWSEAALDHPHRDLLYRPLSVTSYRLVRVLVGPSPLPQHLVNLALYALICAMVVHLSRSVGADERAALVAGLLFAALPVHTEVVNNVVGRADLLAGVGTMAALLAHRRTMPAVTARRSAGWRLVAGAAALLAMTSKESGVAVVLLVPLFDAFWHRTMRLSAPRKWLNGETVRRSLYLLLPAVLYVALRFHALGGALYQQPHITKTINVLVDAPPWQQALGVVQLWGMYWAKTIWPAVLSVNYSVHAIRLATGPLDPHVLLGAAVLTTLLAASVTAWRRGQPQVALLSAAIALTYLPTSNAVVLMQVFLAERNWFLPSVWVSMLIGMGMSAILPRSGRGPVAAQSFAFARFGTAAHAPTRSTGSNRVPVSVWLSVVTIVVLAMTVRCWMRNAEWRHDGTLYAAAYRDLPDAVGAQYLYGQWLVSNGEYEKGVSLLSRAIEIDLGFTDAHRALGQAHLRAGNLPAALEHLKTANMQAPGHPPTEASLQRVSQELAARDDELKRLADRAETAQHDLETELALTRRLRDLGLVEEASQRFQLGEARFADSPDWQAEYAVTLVMLDRLDEAIERYRASLQQAPNHAQRAAELAGLLLERRKPGDLDEAGQWSEHALKLAPYLPSVLACRAELLALRGDLVEAWALYRQAIARLPPESPQRRFYEQRAKTLGARR